MKEPIHKVKRRLKRLDGSYFWTKPEEIYGWLASGLKDKNGREIFEGARVVFGELGNTGTVNFRNAMFVIDHDGSNNFTVLGNAVGFVDVEVVGHIAEDEQ